MSKYKKALLEIQEIIGYPCSDNKCLGCRWEMLYVCGVVGKALGVSVDEKHIHRTTKDVGLKRCRECNEKFTSNRLR